MQDTVRRERLWKTGVFPDDRKVELSVSYEPLSLMCLTGLRALSLACLGNVVQPPPGLLQRSPKSSRPSAVCLKSASHALRIPPLAAAATDGAVVTARAAGLFQARRISENVDHSFFWEWPLVSSVYSEVVFPPAVQLVVLHIYYLTKGITRTPTAGGRATVQITHSLATCRGSLVT